MPLIDKSLVTQHFNRAAKRYDQVTPVQLQLAAQLVESTQRRFPAAQPHQILELGCGTGIYTRCLRAAFPLATIVAVDIAPAMVDMARQTCADLSDLEFHVADAESADTPPFNQSFDLISSNATVQWLTNPAQSMIQWFRMLSAHGVLSFTSFGPRTFHELGTAFRDAEQQLCLPPRPHLLELASAADLRSWLTAAGYATIDVVESKIVRNYPTPRELLRAIRDSGATAAYADAEPISRTVYHTMSRIYAERFSDSGGQIQATYHGVVALAGTH